MVSTEYTKKCATPEILKKFLKVSVQATYATEEKKSLPKQSLTMFVLLAEDYGEFWQFNCF